MYVNVIGLKYGMQSHVVDAKFSCYVNDKTKLASFWPIRDA